MQALNVDQDYQVKSYQKNSDVTQTKDITLNSRTQTGEKWDSLVLSRGDF